MDSCQACLFKAYEVIDTLVTQSARTGVSGDPVDLRESLLEVVQNENELFHGQD